jgi:hypothetical protein
MNLLLDRLVSIYGPPEAPEPEVFLTEVSKMIGGYSSEELERAVQIVCSLNKSRSYPAIHVITEGCAKARTGLNSERKPPQQSYDDKADEAMRMADSLICSHVGRTAANEGWIGQLWDFCRKKGRLPGDAETRILIDEAALFDQAYEKVAAVDEQPITFDDGDFRSFGSLNPALRKLGASFVRRREHLSRIANGDAI